MESIGQNVDQEPADELDCGQAHNLLAIPALDPVILPTERNSVSIRTDQSMVRDRDPMGIAAEIGQHRLRAAKWGFGIYHPFRFAERGEPLRKGILLRQVIEIAKEGELACAVRVLEPIQKQASEQPSQHPNMQKEPRFAGDPPRAIRR